MLDILVAAAIEEGPRDNPPETPATGSAYIVGPAPTGVWSGHAHSIAAFTAAGWRLVPPVEGMQAWVKATASWATFVAGAWEIGAIRAQRLLVGGVQVVGAQSLPIAEPAGGGTVDAEARAAIASILGAMRAHGLIASA